MKIYSRITYRWNGSIGEYEIGFSDSFDYNGPVELCCGATPGQSAIANQTSQFSQQLTQQASTVFGNSSTVFNDLVSSFSPTVAAGPSQQGYSQAELSNLNSQAITNTGNAYKNAKAAVGDAASAVGGGNDSQVSGGSTTGADLSVANAAAAQTSSELSGIQTADYAQGNQNYNNAVSGLAGATGVFNPATSAAGAATSSQNAASGAANSVASSNNSWMGLVSAGLGDLTGIATAGINNMGSSPAPSAPSALNLGSGDQGQMLVNPTTSSSNELL